MAKRIAIGLTIALVTGWICALSFTHLTLPPSPFLYFSFFFLSFPSFLFPFSLSHFLFLFYTSFPASLAIVSCVCFPLFFLFLLLFLFFTLLFLPSSSFLSFLLLSLFFFFLSSSVFFFPLSFSFLFFFHAQAALRLPLWSRGLVDFYNTLVYI